LYTHEIQRLIEALIDLFVYTFYKIAFSFSLQWMENLFIFSFNSNLMFLKAQVKNHARNLSTLNDFINIILNKNNFFWRHGKSHKNTLI
jgi:hypothetical protein